jgi:glycosyltransferase involved in cell wall biosynthesis
MKLFVLTNKTRRASCKQRIGIYADILRNNGIECETAVFHSGIFARLKQLKYSRDFDAVFLQKKRIRFLDAIWAKCYCRKIIYDIDDAVMYSDKTGEHESRSRMRRFARTARTADMVIAGNPYLADQAKQFNDNVCILPTGLRVAEYNCKAQQPQKDNKIRLVWIGSRSTLKYLAEITPALESIGKRFDNVVLRIICDDFLDLRQMQVEKCRWALETQASDLAACDIGLAPLPDNRFTRGKCGFKILQYASASLPAVASPIGVNAELVQNEVNGFLAESINQWTESISRLIEDKQLLKKMGQNNLAMVKDYDIDAIGKRLVKLIEHL